MMEFKRFSITLMGILFFLGLFLFIKRSKMAKLHHTYTIGIMQTASHPALDAVKYGFMDAVRDALGEKVNFTISNGQGSISTVHTIAEQFHVKSDVDAIFAIATPAAQAAISLEKEKPIIVAAVTVSPNLQDIFAASNVCGVSDMINVQKEVEAMKQLLPQDLKTVGIVFSSGEINSIIMANIMVKELEEIGYTPVLIGIPSESDVESAILSATRKVDIILAPTDNVVANSIALISEIVQQAGKPLIVSDNLLVQYGALMARGVDYYQSGIKAGQMAVQIALGKKTAQDIGIASVDNQKVYINKQELDLFGWSVPESLVGDVVFV